MTDFSKFYSKENARSQLRETINLLVSDALKEGMSPLDIADELYLQTSIFNADCFSEAFNWNMLAVDALERIRDGEWTTENDVRHFIADRVVNARPPRA